MITEYIAKKDLLKILNTVGSVINMSPEHLEALINAIDAYPSKKARKFVGECEVDKWDFIESDGRAEAYVRSVIAAHLRGAIEPYFKMSFEDIKETERRRVYGELEVLL